MTAAFFDLAPDVVELAAFVPGPAAALRPLREVAFRANAWLPSEVERLRGMFAADEPIEAICAALDRPRAGVSSKLWELGLRRNSHLPWSEFEDEEVARRYGVDPASEIAQELGRGVAAVYCRAQFLGLAETGSPPWTEWEDAQVREGYAAGVPIFQVAALIGRSLAALNTRASKLGVRHLHTPPGWSIEEAGRSLELAQTGMRYLEIIEQLVTEGFPRRTKAGLGPKLRKLGYGRGWGRPWQPDEDELLRHAYAAGDSLVDLAGRLGRTKHSLKWRGEALGLQGSHPKHDGWRGRVWTPAELKRLREAYGKVPTKDLARELNRGRMAVCMRAQALGIPHGWMREFSADEDRAIHIAWHQGLPLRAVANATDRDQAVIHKRAKRIGLIFGDPARPAKASRGRGKPAWTLSLADILALEPNSGAIALTAPPRRNRKSPKPPPARPAAGAPMPIRPENKARYPKDWAQISEQVRERAGWRCEGSPAFPDCRAENAAPHPVTGSIVVLTVAHLDHTPENIEPENLKAWCQRCHNVYDAPMRRAGIRARARAAMGCGDLFEGARA